MYQRDAAATYEAAKATRLAMDEQRRKAAAEQQETSNRKASCPRCKARNPDPCIEKNAAGEWHELELCHPTRAQRRLQGW
jgi:hypothetical protein